MTGGLIRSRRTATNLNSEGTSYSESTSVQRQQLFDSNDFRRLNTDYALFLGNIGDQGRG
jgi:hypothetical protein